MAYDRVVSEIVTKFFLDTCQLHQQLNDDSLLGLCACFAAAVSEGDFIPLTTGSVAELYILPMITCFGDVDVMCHWNYELAIPAGTAPSTQLPAEFHSHVTVNEIMTVNSQDMCTWCVLTYLQNALKTASTAPCGVDVSTCHPILLMLLTGYTGRRLSLSQQFSVLNMSEVLRNRCNPQTGYTACVVCRGRHKPLTGHHDTESTAGQTQKL